MTRGVERDPDRGPVYSFPGTPRPCIPRLSLLLHVGHPCRELLLFARPNISKHKTNPYPVDSPDFSTITFGHTPGEFRRSRCGRSSQPDANRNGAKVQPILDRTIVSAGVRMEVSPSERGRHEDPHC